MNESKIAYKIKLATDLIVEAALLSVEGTDVPVEEAASKLCGRVMFPTVIAKATIAGKGLQWRAKTSN